MSRNLTTFSVVAILTSALALVEQPSSSAQAVRVTDLNPGAAGSFPSNLTVYAESLVFGAYTQATGFELWKYDGATVQLIADINPTSDDLGNGIKEGNDSLTDWLTVFNGNLYFSAFEPRRGAELWTYNGTTASRVSDISPDLNDTIKLMPRSSWPNQLTVFNNSLYFSANSGTVSTNYELWKYDGLNVTLVANIHPDGPGDQSSYPIGLHQFGSDLYFMANDGSNGYEPWKHQGSTTTLLTNINPGLADSSSFPKFFTAIDNLLYFQAFNSSVGFELWKTDGATVELVADIAAGAESSNPDGFAVYNGQLYFRATDGLFGCELWKYDGLSATRQTDLNGTGDSFPKNLTVFNGSLYFSATDGVHGWELWKWDGSQATLVRDLNETGDSFPEEFTILGNKLYFIAETPEHGRELRVFDGASVTLAADLNPGPGSSYPQFLTPVNNQLFFRAAGDGLNDFELWKFSPPSGLPPTVNLTFPAPGSIFLARDPIDLAATATDESGIASVEFFANSTSLGIDLEAPYSIATSLTAGPYLISALATDRTGIAQRSAEVQIQVVAQPVITSISHHEGLTSISVSATPNRPVTMEWSFDLRSWNTLATQAAPDGQVTFSDSSSESRFYRARLE